METPMTLAALARQFVDLCNQGKNFDVMRTLYAPDIVSVEAGGGETAGKDAVIKKSERWAATLTAIHGEKVLGPYFSIPNPADTTSGQFAVHFTFDITPRSTGKRMTQQEVGLYTVKDGLITREQFFYEGDW
jgi:hypothetical protein